MADFCLQCSQGLGAPEGWSDLRGVCDPHHDAALALCEGCGWVLVDRDGRCVGMCQEHHSDLSEEDSDEVPA